MTEVANSQALRGIVGSTNGELYYVKGHKNLGDGGEGVFMWRTYDIFKNPTTGIYINDNNGTILKTTSSTGWNVGRWVRQYEGHINVLYFGAFGKTQDYTTAFQNAIDFASLYTLNDPELKGSVEIASPNTINCGRNKLIFVKTSTTIIKTITSSINASEMLIIRANNGSITFDNTNNIFLTLKSSLALNNGEIATFVKIDNIVGSNYETYQLFQL